MKKQIWAIVAKTWSEPIGGGLPQLKVEGIPCVVEGTEDWAVEVCLRLIRARKKFNPESRMQFDPEPVGGQGYKSGEWWLKNHL